MSVWEIFSLFTPFGALSLEFPEFFLGSHGSSQI